MRDVNRIKVMLKELERHWNKYPDMRFGQLLINLGVCEDSMRLWGLEDDKLIEWLKEVKL